MRRTVLLGVILFLTCVAVFSPVYQGEFLHWDDDLNITGNAHVHKFDRETIRWMFTDFSHMRRYVPMSWLTWALTYQFFGPNPHAFHLEGILLHATNALLIFLLLKKICLLYRRDDNEEKAILPAFLGAVIWAIHPLRVEVVAWANCQMYAQALLFVLLSTFLYLRGIQAESSKRFWSLLGSTFFLLLSLLTYPVAFGFVAVLFVIDIFLLKRLPINPVLWLKADWRVVVVEKILFIVTTLGVACVTLWARSHLSTFWQTNDQSVGFGWPSRIAQAFYIWAYYIWKPVFSFQLSPVYTQLTSFRPTDWPFVASFVGVIGATVFLWIKRARWPWAFGLWLCHLALLVPMLGLTEHPHYPNDRYNYVESILASVFLMFFIRGLTGKWQKVAPALVLTGSIFLGFFAFQQTHMWHSNTVFFETIVEKLGNDPYQLDTLWRLGKAYVEEDDHVHALAVYNRAVKMAPQSVVLQQLRSDIHVSAAKALLEKSDTNSAIAEYELGKQCNSNNFYASYNLGLLLEQQNKISEALENFKIAIRIDTNHANAYNGLGRCLAKAGNMEDAMRAFAMALKISPNNAYANFNIGHALMSQNKFAEALDYYNEAIKAKPDFAEGHYQIGTCLAMTGRVADALPYFTEAARLNPNSPDFFLGLGMASAQTGRFASAISAYRAALRLNPDYLRAVINLGWILASHQDANLRNGAEALDLAKHAVELTQEKDFDSFDLLAAAYAECNKFPEAATAISKAIALADSYGRKERAMQLEARLELYKAERPLRQ